MLESLRDANRVCKTNPKTIILVQSRQFRGSCRPSCGLIVGENDRSDNQPSPPALNSSGRRSVAATMCRSDYGQSSTRLRKVINPLTLEPRLAEVRGFRPLGVANAVDRRLGAQLIHVK